MTAPPCKLPELKAAASVLYGALGLTGSFAIDFSKVGGSELQKYWAVAEQWRNVETQYQAWLEERDGLIWSLHAEGLTIQQIALTLDLPTYSISNRISRKKKDGPANRR